MNSGGGGKGEGAEAVVGVVVVVVGVVVGVVLVLVLVVVIVVVLVVVVVIVVVYYKFKSTTRAPPTRTGRGNFSQRGKVGGHMGGSEQQPLFIISIVKKKFGEKRQFCVRASPCVRRL